MQMPHARALEPARASASGRGPAPVPEPEPEPEPGPAANLSHPLASSATLPATGAQASMSTAQQWGSLALYVTLALLMTSIAVTTSLLWNAAFQHWIGTMSWSQQKSSKFIVASVFTVAGVAVVLLFVFIAALAGMQIPATAIVAQSGSVAA